MYQRFWDAPNRSWCFTMFYHSPSGFHFGNDPHILNIQPVHGSLEIPPPPKKSHSKKAVWVTINIQPKPRLVPLIEILKYHVCMQYCDIILFSVCNSRYLWQIMIAYTYNQFISSCLPSGVQNLLSCLEQINVKVGGSDLDLLFLKNLLCSEDVRALLRVSSPFYNT